LKYVLERNVYVFAISTRLKFFEKYRILNNEIKLSKQTFVLRAISVIDTNTSDIAFLLKVYRSFSSVHVTSSSINDVDDENKSSN
jgi:hypothetical protein